VAHDPSLRPKLIIELWDGQLTSWQGGPMEKATRVRWRDLGYDTRSRFLCATHLWGAVRQTRLVVVRTQGTRLEPWDWPALEATSARPCANLLTPPGLIPAREYRPSLPTPQLSPINPIREPMPYSRWQGSPGWIHDEQRGYRRIFLSELAKGLGVPTTHTDGPLTSPFICQTTSVFHWEYLGQSCLPPTDLSKPIPIAFASARRSSSIQLPQLFAAFQATSESRPDSSLPVFEWVPPDLSEQGVWCKDRCNSLKPACAHYPGREHKLYSEGLAIR